MNMTTEIRVGGVERFSLVDWPGRLVATVFCQGCGWRCRYCHNPALLSFGAGTGPRWAEVSAWLETRRGLLDAVVFSGGEPTLQAGLAEAMRTARDMGFAIGLHTGGPVPRALAEVLPLTDWVGFDFKAPFADYRRVTGREGGEAARASLRLVRQAGVAWEVRTTWHPALLSDAELGVMADELEEEGVGRWVVQRFRAEGCADAELGGAQAAGRAMPAGLARAGLAVTER